MPQHPAAATQCAAAAHCAECLAKQQSSSTHVVAARHQVVAEVRAHKAGAAGHQHPVLLRPRLGLDGRPLVAGQLGAALQGWSDRGGGGARKFGQGQDGCGGRRRPWRSGPPPRAACSR